MRWLTFEHAGKRQVGFMASEQVVPFSPVQSMLELIEHYSVAELLKLPRHSEHSLPLSEVQILAPIPEPRRNVFCLGMNYHDHAAELGNQPPEQPIYFTKAIDQATGPGQVVSYPSATQKLDYEVELAVIIGKTARNLTPDHALEHIFGYTIANDLTMRDLQDERNQWFRGKSFDGALPLGPYIRLNGDLSEPDLAIECTVNGEVRQRSRTDQLIFRISDILVDLSRDLTLLPGDIILTGTPSGVGAGFKPPKFLARGDQIVCSIESIGSLETTVE